MEWQYAFFCEHCYTEQCIANLTIEATVLEPLSHIFIGTYAEALRAGWYPDVGAYNNPYRWLCAKHKELYLPTRGTLLIA